MSSLEVLDTDIAFLLGQNATQILLVSFVLYIVTAVTLIYWNGNQFSSIQDPMVFSDSSRNHVKRTKYLEQFIKLSILLLQEIQHIPMELYVSVTNSLNICLHFFITISMHIMNGDRIKTNYYKEQVSIAFKLLSPSHEWSWDHYNLGTGIGQSADV